MSDFRYSSQIMGRKGSEELMICILNGNGNPIDSYSHKINDSEVMDIISATTGAHTYGIEGWELDPADQYQGYATKTI